MRRLLTVGDILISIFILRRILGRRVVSCICWSHSYQQSWKGRDDWKDRHFDVIFHNQLNVELKISFQRSFLLCNGGVSKVRESACGCLICTACLHHCVVSLLFRVIVCVVYKCNFSVKSLIFRKSNTAYVKFLRAVNWGSLHVICRSTQVGAARLLAFCEGGAWDGACSSPSTFLTLKYMFFFICRRPLDIKCKDIFSLSFSLLPSANCKVSLCYS